jgi:excisionase family DNA binding protein
VKLLKVPDVAETLACSPATVYALIESGQLTAVRIGAGGGGVRVTDADLATFVESRRTTAAPPVPATRPKKKVALRHLK